MDLLHFTGLPFLAAPAAPTWDKLVTGAVLGDFVQTPIGRVLISVPKRVVACFIYARICSAFYKVRLQSSVLRIWAELCSAKMGRLQFSVKCSLWIGMQRLHSD